MSTNYKQPGDVVTWTNSTGSAVSSGDPVQVGLRQMGVALVDIANAATGSVALEGVFSLPKAAGALSEGKPCFWDGTQIIGAHVPTIGTYFVGFCANAAGSSAATVDVSLEEFCYEGPRQLTLAATGTQTLTAGDFLSGNLTLLGTATAAHTVNLPALAGVPHGANLRLKKISGGAYAITLDGASSETIGGGATYASVDADNDLAIFQKNAITWQLIDTALA
jgi:predicted RecA/RadA family phage recombinase